MAALQEAQYRIKELTRENEELVDLLEEVFGELPECDPDLEQKVLLVLAENGALR